ncbi:MAG: hypothetical protein EHM41_09000 [Chloroflexi bacterium]|nr:MAG: hypothetical protein EHM41_09000 [Chloroflexota bacterium]
MAETWNDFHETFKIKNEVDSAKVVENSGLYLGDVIIPRNLTKPPRSGDACPKCKRGKLDYDGMLNLSCSECGYTLAGCFT